MQTARLLLDAGADPNRRQDNEGGSPFSGGYGFSEMRALMESHGGRLSIDQAARRAIIERAFR
jgi:hypothetical protein